MNILYKSFKGTSDVIYSDPMQLHAQFTTVPSRSLSDQEILIFLSELFYFNGGSCQSESGFRMLRKCRNF